MKNNIVFRLYLLGFIFATLVTQSCDDLDKIDSQRDIVNANRSLTVTADSAYVFNAVNARQVVFGVNASTPWKIESSADWCTVTPLLSDSSSLIEDVTILVEENSTEEERKAVLTVSAQNIAEDVEIHVSQMGLGVLEVDSIADIFDEVGGSLSFTLKTNETYSIRTSADWLSIDPSTGVGSQDVQTIQVTATDNSGNLFRSSSIEISTTTLQYSFVVKQDGEYLRVESDEDLMYSYNAASFNVNIESSVDWNVVVPEGVDWITAGTTSGSGNGTVSFSVDKNQDFDRSSYVYFISVSELVRDSVLVSQEGVKVPFTREFWGDNSSLDKVTFHDDGTARFESTKGNWKLWSNKTDFSYGKYTLNLEDVTVNNYAIMVLRLVNPATAVGIDVGVYKSGGTWNYKYRVGGDFGSQPNQEVPATASPEELKTFVIDVKKSSVASKVDVSIYINDELLYQEFGANDGFEAVGNIGLYLWLYNGYESAGKVDGLTLNSFIYEPY